MAEIAEVWCMGLFKARSIMRHMQKRLHKAPSLSAEQCSTVACTHDPALLGFKGARSPLTDACSPP